MSEYNMTTAAARRVDQSKPQGDQAVPAYDLSFLLALEPALEDLARHRIKLAVNAGVADTETLYKVVSQMVQSKGLDLKVLYTPYSPTSTNIYRSHGYPVTKSSQQSNPPYRPESQPSRMFTPANTYPTGRSSPSTLNATSADWV